MVQLRDLLIGMNRVSVARKCRNGQSATLNFMDDSVSLGFALEHFVHCKVRGVRIATRTKLNRFNTFCLNDVKRFG